MKTTKAYIQPVMEIVCTAPSKMFCGSPYGDSVSVGWGGGDGGGHHVAGSNDHRGDFWSGVWGDEE